MEENNYSSNMSQPVLAEEPVGGRKRLVGGCTRGRSAPSARRLGGRWRRPSPLLRRRRGLRCDELLDRAQVPARHLLGQAGDLVGRRVGDWRARALPWISQRAEVRVGAAVVARPILLDRLLLVLEEVAADDVRRAAAATSATTSTTVGGWVHHLAVLQSLRVAALGVRAHTRSGRHRSVAHVIAAERGGRRLCGDRRRWQLLQLLRRRGTHASLVVQPRKQGVGLAVVGGHRVFVSSVRRHARRARARARLGLADTGACRHRLSPSSSSSMVHALALRCFLRLLRLSCVLR